MSRTRALRYFHKKIPNSEDANFRLVIFLVGLIFMKGVLAQDGKHQWLNQELKSKGTTQEIYNAIGKGDLAQCTADAQLTAQRASAVQDCSQLSSNGNPFLFQDCNERNSASRRNAEELYKNLVVGCMAKRGWLWTKLQ